MRRNPDNERRAAIWIPYDDDAAEVACASCNWTGPIYETEGVRNIWARISAGEIVPAGECPKCGALTHIKKGTPVVTVKDNVLTITLPKD